MTTRAIPARSWIRPRLGRWTLGACAGLALAGLTAWRLGAMHAGLLYPDGYQYLLMARGIGEHLQPVATLGPGGDVLAPSSDAAAKPLFPALVALCESLGLSPLDAARLVAALAAAAIAPLAGLVALRLGASRGAAVLTGALCLASPTLGFWLGFPGPEGLAESLALAAGLALLSRRPAVGGVLAGCCVLARPELGAIAVTAALAAYASERLRHDAVVASASGLATAGAVIAVLRPPLSLPTLLLLPAAVALGCAAAPALALARRSSARASTVAALSLVGVLLVALVHGSAWSSLGRRDWPLLALASAGLVLACRSAAARAHALRIATIVVALALAYWWKNPDSERYVALLLPALAVLAGLGLDRLGRARYASLTAAAGLALVGALAAGVPSVGQDSFSEIAARLEHAPAGPLVTAAPDAYGVLLPGRAVRVMRPGAAGLVLVDGAARAYDADLGVRGRLVARIPSGNGFLRPDGRIDDGAALLYRGRVVALPR